MSIRKICITDATTKDVEVTATVQTSAIVPSSWSEVDIFSLFLWRFGRPNGFLSFAIGGEGDPDAPFKYDFLFNLPDHGTFDLVRSSQSLEIRSRDETTDPADLLEFLQYNLSRHRSHIAETKNQLEEYVLLVNPYQRHKSIANHAREKMDGLDLERPNKPVTGQLTRQELGKYIEKMNCYIDMVHMECLYSVLLVTESVFSVEALLNLTSMRQKSGCFLNM